MEREGLPLHFVKTILLLGKVQTLTRDNFFLDKFNSKMYGFSLTFLELLKGNELSVAQCEALVEKHLSSIDSLRDVLKEFKYLNIIKDTPLLLQAELNLLGVRLEVYRRKKETEPKKGYAISTELSGQKSEQENTKVLKTVFRKNGNLNSSKKKILDFIKSYPNTRTKDIVYEFNALSGRTVKRSLTDLLRAGLVKKRIDNKAVYYYASE